MPMLAEVDHRVTGFDTDSGKVETLNAGRSYIHHIPQSKIQQFVVSRRFCAAADFARFKECDAILISVPTPLDERREHRFELHRTTRSFHLSAPAKGAGDLPRIHHLSGDHGRAGLANPGKKRLELPHRIGMQIDREKYARGFMEFKQA